MKFKEYLEEAHGKKYDWYVTLSLRGAKEAVDIIEDMFQAELRSKDLKRSGTNQWVSRVEDIMYEVVNTLQDKGIDIEDTNVED